MIFPQLASMVQPPQKAGLLSFLQDPNNRMPLLMAGANMLQASGPSTTPRSLGQVMGAGLTGYLQGNQQQQDNEFRKSQQAFLKQKQAHELERLKSPANRKMFRAVDGRMYYEDTKQPVIAGLTPQGSSAMQEFDALKNMSPEDQELFFKAKRGGFSVGGVQYDPSGNPIVDVDTIADTTQKIEGSKTVGKNAANKFKELGDTRISRLENIKEAESLLDLLRSGKVQTGRIVDAIRLLPGADIQRLNAFAEQAARARLKANGEIRPTDADVVGMKRAMFGADKVEDFNIHSLERMVREMQAEEENYQDLNALYGTGDPTTSLSLDDLVNKYAD